MRRQRNNIATKIPFELRRVINRMLVDGFAYKQIAAELKRQFPSCPVLHNTTLGAWQRSAEYLRFRTAREANREEMEETRALAEAINDGRGPESTTDVIIMELVRQIHGKIKAGEITNLDDIGAVTKALAPILRAQAAAELAEGRRREADLAAQIETLKAQHAADLAELDQQLESKDAELETLRNPQSGPLTPEAKIAAIRERLGVAP